jgi:hypothetical protein
VEPVAASRSRKKACKARLEKADNEVKGIPDHPPVDTLELLAAQPGVVLGKPQ